MKLYAIRDLPTRLCAPMPAIGQALHRVTRSHAPVYATPECGRLCPAPSRPNLREVSICLYSTFLTMLT